jgi:hypothetical protein
MSLSLAIVPVIEMGAASLSLIFVLAHQCTTDKPGAVTGVGPTQVFDTKLAINFFNS